MGMIVKFSLLIPCIDVDRMPECTRLCGVDTFASAVGKTKFHVDRPWYSGALLLRTDQRLIVAR